MTASTILQQHIAQAGNQPATAELAALLPIASDRGQLLAQIDRRITEVDREQYGMAKSAAPRDDAFKARYDGLGSRFRVLRRLQDALKTGN